jgi:hypothetical protein
MKVRTLTHRFVEYIPGALEEGTIYVSIPFATVVHKCCCGCGHEVVTPLSPTDWKLVFDGETVSLDPSIGNWSFDCRSHYWIRRNQVRWAEQWSQERIDTVRRHDQAEREQYYATADAETESVITPEPQTIQANQNWWQKFVQWVSRRGRKRQ